MLKKNFRHFCYFFLRYSPLKTNRILRSIKNFTYKEILIILNFLSFSKSIIIFKFIKSFIITLYLSKKFKKVYSYLNGIKFFNIKVQKGPISKKLEIRSKGYTGIRKKRFSHIYIENN